MIGISWFVLLATVVLPTLIALEVLRDGVSLAAAFAVLTTIVVEAILTLPQTPTAEKGVAPNSDRRQFVLIFSTLAASMVLSFELRFFALPVVAIPMLVNAAIDDSVRLFV